MPKTIKCPVCNKRVFDAAEHANGLIYIKCPRCKQMVQVELKSETAFTAKATTKI